VYWRKSLLAAVLLPCVVAVAACGSSNSSTSSASSTAASTSKSAAASSSGGTANAAVVKLVPASLKSKGTLTVASDATYAPNEFIGSDGHTVVGMDADLSKALAAVMGLKANIVNATFDTIIPGLAAGKYDMGASSFSDNKEREKTVDFVDYFIAGESFITKASGGTSISSIADICGKTVAVEKGTTEGADAGTQSKKCTSAGKPAVKILSFSDQNAANLALSSGRAQLGFLDSPIAEYQVKQSNGQFKVVGAAYATGPYGLAVPKGSYAPALLAALKVVMQNGTYSSILSHWGLTSGAIPAAQVKINGATS
jgi:polar amino acid transport system substrate-binding protein